MKRIVVAAATVTCALTGCAQISDGVPVAAELTLPGASGGEPGVLPTSKTPVPPDGLTCDVDPAPVGVVASVDNPAAPEVTVALPDGWSTTQGEGDVGAKLTGPDGASATVTIAVTQLEPAEAFRGYADAAMAASAVSTVSVLPAGLCDYSGQKLLGSWTTSPQETVEFGDRIAHIWTDTDNYLVAVHVEGPAGPAFDPFTSPLMDDFAVVIP
jgi:hypothetical protein